MRELEADLGIPTAVVSEILMQDLGMKCVMAKFVQQLLLPKQREHHAAVANDLIQTTTNEPGFLKKVTTLKGTEVSLSYVQCFLYLVPSSINVSIFHITWLNTFWTGLIYLRDQNSDQVGNISITPREISCVPFQSILPALATQR